MTQQTPRGLVELLRGRVLRCRTGILLLSKSLLDKQPDLAARLGIDTVDYAELLLAGLPEGTAFVNISDETEVHRLHDLAEDRDRGDCLMVCNLDLALAKLDSSQRRNFWADLLERFPHRSRALILAIPSAAGHLMPPDADLTKWKESGRLANAVVVPDHTIRGDDYGTADEGDRDSG